MTASRTKALWVNLGLAAAIAIILVVAFAIGSGRIVATDAESFAGTDGQATEVVTGIDPDFEPLLAPLFEVESSEVESGLFALQAGIGGAVLGYAIGALATRRRYEQDTRPSE